MRSHWLGGSVLILALASNAAAQAPAAGTAPAPQTPATQTPATPDSPAVPPASTAPGTTVAPAPVPVPVPTITPAMPSPTPSSAPPALTPAVATSFPPGTNAANFDRGTVVGVAPTGVTAMGPAIVVSGCVQAVNRKGDDDAFDLQGAGAALAISNQASPQGVGTYHLMGSLPDIKRHVGQRVEVIGLVEEGSSPDSSTPLTLNAKSVRATDDKCSR
jgi:hypothetical protein